MPPSDCSRRAFSVFNERQQVKDYTLHQLEERIVLYADRVADIIHEDVVGVSDGLEAERRFKESLIEYLKYGENDLTRNNISVAMIKSRDWLPVSLNDTLQLMGFGTRPKPFLSASGVES